MLRGITVATRIEDAAARLEALGNPTRLAVFRLLVRAGEDGLAVGQLQKRLKIAGSTLSHHLRALITVDLVSQERQGTTLTCRAGPGQPVPSACGESRRGPENLNAR